MQPQPSSTVPADASSAADSVTLRMLVLMLVRGAINGNVGPFGTVLLLQAGLAPALIGPMAAGAAVATLLGAPWWGRMGDRHGRRRVLTASFLIAIPIAGAYATGLLPVVAIGYVTWAFVTAAFVSLTDSLALARLGGSRSRFARVRVGASGAYVLVVILVGAAVSFSWLGWAAPGVIGMGLCVFGTVAVAARLRGELVKGTGVATSSELGLLDGIRAGVARYRGFLVGMSLVWAGINAPGIFTGPRVAEVGGSGWEIGLAIAAGALAELPAFLALPWLLRRVDGRRLFLLGGTLLGIAGVTSALAPTPALLIAARLLFGAGFAWVVIPSLGAITSAAPPSEHAAAAALHFASSALGSLLVAVAGLPLVGLTGSVSAVLAAAAVVTPVGALLALRAWPQPPAARAGAGRARLGAPRPAPR